MFGAADATASSRSDARLDTRNAGPVRSRSRRAFIVTVAAASLAAAAFAVGVREGTFAVGDTDPYGYVSEADLIARGSLHVDQPSPLVHTWPGAQASLVPPGYTLVESVVVPTYPVGLPLAMAVAERIGGRRAVFYVVPLLGALLIWMTARLGARIHSEATGIAAALLLVSSATFLFQVVEPVSDIAAAAWWTTSLVVALRRTRGAAFGSGLAASLAVLTRPNLVPVAAVIAAYLASSRVSGEQSRASAIQRAIWFAAGVLPACVTIAILDRALYGSVLSSGYGDLSDLYAWANVWPNLARYPRWLIETLTPFVLLAFGAPWLARRRGPGGVWLLVATFGVVFASYLLYTAWDGWIYLRFLLPAYPALLVLAVAVAFEIAAVTGGGRKTVAAGALIAALAVWQAGFGVRHGALAGKPAAQRYVDVGRYVARALPPNAVFVAGLHAGSIRYYAGRLTVNFNRLPPSALDEAIAALRARGYVVYFALEDGETPAFRARFAGASDYGRLDWAPRLETFRGVKVDVFDPADRGPYLAGEDIITGDMQLLHAPVLRHR